MKRPWIQTLKGQMGEAELSRVAKDAREWLWVHLTGLRMPVLSADTESMQNAESNSFTLWDGNKVKIRMPPAKGGLKTILSPVPTIPLQRDEKERKKNNGEHHPEEASWQVPGRVVVQSPSQCMFQLGVPLSVLSLNHHVLASVCW